MFLRRRIEPAAECPAVSDRSCISVSVNDNQTFLVAAQGVRLSVVKDVALLFVPGREGLFGVDFFVADLWQRLRSGMSRELFLAAARSAQRDGDRILSDLLGTGALEFIRTQAGPVPVTSRFCIALGNLRLSINYCGSADFAPLRDMLAHLEHSGGDCEKHLLVIGEPERIGFALNGAKVDWFPWEQAAPTLKTTLTDLALQTLDGVALHVATLSAGEDALLLVGAPGAGKSTLSVALGTSGFRLEGDDIATLQPDGCVMALPFPATVKDGAWTALAPCRPDIARRPAYIRPDGKRVRYLELEPGVPPARHVRTVLCLDRTAASPAGLTPLGVQDSVAALLEGAWSADKKLASKDFDALMACLGGADFYRMTYETLEEAISLTRTAWQSAPDIAPAVAR